MPKRTDIHKILVIGSGPIVIGQAAEFDYAGTQACLALKEEGYEVVLCNSNPATIMTDTAMADKVYMEPLTLEYLARIIRFERPDALLPGIGGQTGLNLAMQLEKKGVLRECGVELLGTKSDSIAKAEDREQFKALCRSLGEPVLPSEVAASLEEGRRIAEKIGYPVVLRPAFTLGGTGGGFAQNETQLQGLLKNGLKLSPVGQVLIEKSVKGYKEIEYEVMRDGNDAAVTVCNMENMDPVGIHTGDSIVVCPSQTLTNKDYQTLRSSALKIIRALQIEGGCNVQFALDPRSSQYYLIEVNPRVSRSSALASKASGYPIARVSAKIGIGMTLDEIMDLMLAADRASKEVVRLHTGDPSVYGAIREQMDFLDEHHVDYDACPGVSACFGAAASLKLEYTLPGKTQTLIMTRMAGKTAVPEKESIRSLAAHGASMAIYLSTGMLGELAEELIRGGYAPDTPAALVYKATWPEERCFLCTLASLADTGREHGIGKTAVVLVGDAVLHRGGYERSKLYDPAFETEFRKI